LHVCQRENKLTIQRSETERWQRLTRTTTSSGCRERERERRERGSVVVREGQWREVVGLI